MPQNDSNGNTVCRCNPITGCGHLMGWHVVVEMDLARCLVPGCECRVTEFCDHVLSDAPRHDRAVLAEIGITL